MIRKTLRKPRSRPVKQMMCDYQSLEPKQLLASITVSEFPGHFNAPSNIRSTVLMPFADGAAAIVASASTGFEIWFSEADESGGQLLDVLRGPASSNPSLLASTGEALFFSATSPSGLRGLWATDGTMEGTHLLTEAFDDHAVNAKGEFQNRIFFSGYAEGLGFEPWLSDGTADGTYLIGDLSSGTQSSIPFDPVEFNGKLYFASRFGLFQSDGTPDSAIQISPDNIDRLAGTSQWLFIQDDNKLLVSDGTSVGTTEIYSFVNLELSNENSIVAGDRFYFEADDGTGPSLWVSDGTEFGTIKLAKVSNNSGFTAMSLADDNLYFLSNGAIWKSSLDSGETFEVQLESPVSTNEIQIGEDNRVYYVSNQAEIWSTNGENSGSRFEGQLGTDIAHGFVVNGKRVFALSDTSPTNHLSMWVLDNGTAETVSPQSDLINGLVVKATATSGDRYFTLNQIGDLVVESNGTSKGTQAAEEFGTAFVNPGSKMIGLNDYLLLVRNDPFVGPELWIFDTTTDKLRTIQEIDIVDTPIVDGDYAYFASRNSEGKFDVMQTDGTIEGTQVMFTVRSVVRNLTVIDGSFYFSSGRQFFASDGTQEGTRPLLIREQLQHHHNNVQFAKTRDDNIVFKLPNAIMAFNGSSASKLVETPAHFDEHELLSKDGLVYYASNSPNDFEVWVTDGTQSGTKLLATGERGNAYLTVFNNEVFFANNGQLFKTDGTVGGTEAVSTLRMEPQHLTVFDGSLYFSGSTPATGEELWMSDGTSAGTTIVQDYILGPGDTQVSNLRATQDTLFFLYSSDTTGTQIGFLDRSSLRPSQTLGTAFVNSTSTHDHQAINLIDLAQPKESSFVRQAELKLSGSYEAYDQFFATNLQSPDSLISPESDLPTLSEFDLE